MYLRAAIILLFVLISQTLFAQIHEEGLENEYLHYIVNNSYEGTIGKKNQIFMSLKIDLIDKSLSGYYYYKKEKRLIDLKGRFESNWSFTLTESILYKDNGQIKVKETGSFVGRFEDAYNIMKGKWSSSDKKKKNSFNLQADEDRTYISYRKHSEYNHDEPSYLNNLQIHNNLKELLKNRIEDKRMSLEANRTDAPIIIHASENILSILIHYTQERNSGHVSLNFWLVDNSIKELRLSDLFMPNSNYLKILSDFCIIELRRQSAVDTNSDWDVSKKFSITPESLKFYFARFGAEGERFCEIPHRKIRNIINPNGPLSEFMLSKEAPYMKNPDKDMALIDAIKDFDEEAVKALLKEGANANVKDGVENLR